MHSKLEQLVHSWGDNELSEIRLQVASLERWLYWTYEPDKFGEPDFDARLARWLDNVKSDGDKKLLFRLLVQLFYIGPFEFEELFRSAYEGPVARWIAGCIGLDICASDAQSTLRQASEATWFCPITDSFRINAFFHINNLPPAGGSLRPDWRSLHCLGDLAKINAYVSSQGIKRLVLLEDFVGGGSQSLAAVQFASTQLQGVQVLFAPLVICPEGATNARAQVTQLNASKPNVLTFDPVLELPAHAFLNSADTPFGLNHALTADLRQLIHATYPAVSGGRAPGPEKPYHPFGYPYPPNNPTGGLVVMHTNTPDNTLPLVHWRPKANTWEPIFYRHSRD